MSIRSHSDQTIQEKFTNTLWQLAPDVSVLTGLNLSGAFVVKNLFSPDFSIKTAAGVGFAQALIFRGIDAITEQTKKVLSNEHYQHSLIEAAGLGLKVVVPWNSASMTESIGIQLSEDQASLFSLCTISVALEGQNPLRLSAHLKTRMKIVYYIKRRLGFYQNYRDYALAPNTKCKKVQ